MGNSKSAEAQAAEGRAILSNADDLCKKAEEAHATGKFSESLQLYNSAVDCCYNALKAEGIDEKTRDDIRNKYTETLELAVKMQEETQAAKSDKSKQKATAAKAKSSIPKRRQQVVDNIASKPVGIEAATTLNVCWDDIAGLTAAKESLKEVLILPDNIPHLYKGKMQPCRGVLLYGPTGSGKSQLCKAAATESGSAFFSISSNFLNCHQGQSERVIKLLFDTARANKPAVIFISKLEYLFLNRSVYSYDVWTRLKREFLYQMRQDNNGVVVLGTTNAPWQLDADVVRHFDKQLFIDLPNTEARTEMFQKNFRNTKNNVDYLDCIRLGQLTEGYSGADIEVIVRESLMWPIRKIQSATHFRKVEDPESRNSTYLYTPYPPSTSNTIEMKWTDVPSSQLLEPDVTYNDCLLSIQNTRPTVTAAEIAKFIMFANQ